MKYFENKEEFVKRRVFEIGSMPLKEGSHLFADFPGKSIKEATSECLSREISSVKNPAIIFLRVVLAANRNYNKHVRKNIERIETQYPSLRSFEDLERLLNSQSKEEFFQLWGHKNDRKYNVLVNLLIAAKVLKSIYKIEDDYELMNRWATDVNLERLNEDMIYNIEDVALATVQHLRMDFGVNTVKPDQRVIEVLEREFGLTSVSQRRAIAMVEEISKITGIRTREVDLIFVNYGSGYYDNRKSNSIYSVRVEIARNLLNKDLDKKTIADVTGLTEPEIKRLNNEIE